MNDLEIAFRTPWYERTRQHLTVNDLAAKRPIIQKYDKTDFVNRIVKDPQDSLVFTDEDKWSYPVPVTLPGPGTGRQRFATSRLVTTNLRKLYQPAHERFYTAVVELFCDAPGLPRAGKHDDLAVSFALRRRVTSVHGQKSHIQKLARELMLGLLAAQHSGSTLDIPQGETAAVRKAKELVISDHEDLWWGADDIARDRFIHDHRELLQVIEPRTAVQAWVVDGATGVGRWADITSAWSPDEKEQRIPMFRLPAEPCDPNHTRSLWFGFVPTYSAEHWNDPAKKGRSVPKLDERAIYQIVCIAEQKPKPGHEHCPPKIWESTGSESFRLAAPYDPAGTKNRRVSISAPDLRLLAARAAGPSGPGGLSISTPPGSQFQFDPLKFATSPGGTAGGGGGVCTFAFELFFIVALFLFLMFLPIIVFAFQLWWLLALRFCFPRFDAALNVLAAFFAGANPIVALDGLSPDAPDAKAALKQVLGDSATEKLIDEAEPGGHFPDSGPMAQAFIEMVDPNGAVTPAPLPVLPHEEDPLCPKA